MAAIATYTKTVTTTCGVTQPFRPRSNMILSGLARDVWSDTPGNFAIWPKGMIFFADGIQKAKKWNGYSSTFQNVGLDAPSGTPAIAGSGSGSITGTYRVYVRFVDADGNVSPLSTASSDTTVSSVSTLTFSSVPTPTDPRVVKRQILRNTTGQLLTFYVDVETTDLWSTSLTSTKVDTSLDDGAAVVLFDEDDNDLTTKFDAPRADKPILVPFRNRMYAMGEVEYRRGNAQVTFGSTTVTGTFTNWTSDFADREFTVAGHPKRYTISSVDQINQTLTLSEVYRGTTNLFASYAIRAVRGQRATVYFSDVDNPEGWPPENSFTLAETDDIIKAGIPAQSYIYVAFQNALYRFTADQDPRLDGSAYLAVKRGCVNQRAWVELDAAFYVLDHVGIYRVSDGQVEEVALQIRDVFSRQTPGKYKIDWTYERYFHAVADRQNAIVRFFVSLSGPSLPRHAIALDILTRQIWLEEYPYPICSSAAWSSAAGERVLLGGPGALLLEHGVGHIDGPNPTGHVTRGAVTASTLMGVTVPTLVLPTSGVVGQPVTIVEGTGKGQTRLIDSWTDSTKILVVTVPWQKAPDTTSVVQVGAVRWLWRSGWFEQIGSDSGAVEVVWEPTDGKGRIELSHYLDRSDKAEKFESAYPLAQSGDVVAYYQDGRELLIEQSYSEGYYRLHIGQKGGTELQQRQSFISVAVGGYTNDEGLQLYELNLGETV